MWTSSPLSHIEKGCPVMGNLIGAGGVCAIDTETHLIKQGKLAPRLVCVSYCDGNASGLLHRKELGKKFHGLLALKAHTIVGHNVAYDMAVLAQNDPSLLPAIFEAYNEGRIRDTGIREQLVDIANGCFRGSYRDDNARAHKREYSLASIAKRRLKIKLEKDDWRLRYSELTHTPISDWPEGAKEYARKDAQVTFEIYEQQTKFSADLKNETAQTRAAFALHLMSCWGVITDNEAVSQLETTLEETMTEKKEELKRLNLIRPNGTKDMSKLRDLVIDCLKGAAPLTKKMQIRTDEQTLKRCDHPTLIAYLEFKRAEKLKSTWLKHLKKGLRGPVQASYNTLVETGRTSCRNPNMQNPHRAPGLRECFIPRKGYVYAACDYAALEMCTLAQVCLWLFESSALAKAINKGIDPHTLLASQILGVSYDAGLGLLKAGGQFRKTRQVAKAANFGYPGGMSHHTFRQFAGNFGIKLGDMEAKELRDSWFDTWPEMRKYFDHISSITKGSQPLLKQFVSNRYRGGVRFTSACNSYFQGLAADGAKAALYHVALSCYTNTHSPLFGSRPVMFIHDEIIAEVPERDAGAAADELSRVMKEVMQVYTPDVKIGTSVALMRRWYKDAEESRNENGELIIWEG